MTQYLGNGPGVGRAARFLFVATAGQTTFSGIDALGYTLTNKGQSWTEVRVDGGVIPTPDYSCPDASTVVIALALKAGAVVDINCLSTFSAADGLSLSQNGADIPNKAAFRSNLGVSGGQLPATVTNDNAATGLLGEYLTAALVVGSQISLTTAISATVVSLSLPAGDWDVWGSTVFGGASGHVSQAQQNSISVTNNAMDLTVGRATSNALAGSTPFNVSPGYIVFSTPLVRVSLASSTPYYLVSRSYHSVSDPVCYGSIFARRRR